MSVPPTVSVVMCVYNGAESLGRTLESVLDQEGIDFELIVIDDGSSDGTAEILDATASADSRLRVVHQENRGLTRGLIRGCSLARGEFITTQDAGGDLALQGKLAKLASVLREVPEASFASGGARYVGPRSELLYEVISEQDEISERLAAAELSTIRGPAHHAAAMFRRGAYLRVGGYRPEFAVAQDLDLWLRLVEVGRHVAIEDVVYQVAVTPDSISSLRRSQQIETARIILECARRRRGGLSEEELLREAAGMPPPTPGRGSRKARGNALYFIGSCLLSRDAEGARGYFRSALGQYPLHGKSWWKLVTSYISSGARSGAA